MQSDRGLEYQGARIGFQKVDGSDIGVQVRGHELNDLLQEDDLRVMDYNGHHVFYNFSLRELGDPVLHEED